MRRNWLEVLRGLLTNIVARFWSSLPTRETRKYACPACSGMECAERPRYFSGQLLTETELNSEQAYILAKNRLHNRYLHGVGVVCGLQVVCHECEGWVTVKEGYAIDPCGNDIVVCKDQDVDVLKLIQDCRGKSKSTRSDCDPISYGTNKSFGDAEEHWCLTISYDEQEARPMSTLRQEKGAVCGCGCNGNGKRQGCGCGCHGQPQKTSYSNASAQVKGGVGLLTVPCEPTRIFEGYRLDICQTSRDCCGEGPTDEQVQAYGTFFDQRLGGKPDLSMLQRILLETAAQDTMLGRIVNCLMPLISSMIKMNSARRLVLIQSAFVPKPSIPAAPQGVTATDVYDDIRLLYRTMREAIVKNSGNVRCDLLERLTNLDCPQPKAGESVQDYAKRIQPCVSDLQKLMVEYVQDCICQNLLPPCPSNQHEDRLILASLTIKDDKIIRICDYSCRRYAGSFPAINYWLSLVPILPLLSLIIGYICCSDDPRKSISDLTLGGSDPPSHDVVTGGIIFEAEPPGT